MKPDAPPSNLEGFTREALLGSGHFGKVYCYRRADTGETRAVKFCSNGGAGIDDPHHEQAAFARLEGRPHKNVVGYYGCMGDGCMAFELVAGGELFDFVIDASSSGDTMPIDTARAFFCQMVDGTEWLHRHGIAHLDLKLENCMLGSDMKTLKIVDLGMWHDLTSGLITDRPYRGSPAYMAPEVFANVQSAMRAMVPYEGTTADVWSLAVCLFVMTCGFYPLDERPLASHYQHIAKKQGRGMGATAAICADDFVHGEYAGLVLSRLPQSLTRLLDEMLLVMPSARATLIAVRESAFVAAQHWPPQTSSVAGLVVHNADAVAAACGVCPYCGCTQTEGGYNETVCTRCGIVVTEGEPCEGAFVAEPWFDDDCEPLPQLRGQPLPDCVATKAVAEIALPLGRVTHQLHDACSLGEPDEFADQPSYRNASSPLPLRGKSCERGPSTSVPTRTTHRQAQPLRRQYNCRHYDLVDAHLSGSLALLPFLSRKR